MGGRMRLGLCHRHRDLMQRVRQDLATVFTALAVLVHASISGALSLQPLISHPL